MLVLSTPSKTLTFLSSIWLCCFFAAASPIVNIKNGTLEGTVLTTRHGREIFAFRGIPYALPPLGALRFKPPQPATAWTGVRLDVEDGPICTQKDLFANAIDVTGQEDCLYLNVFTPSINNSSPLKLLPVMVMFHGGAWISGTGNIYSPKFILDHDVVMVTSNYRLGAIGFLSTEDMVSPGNNGMKDQVQVLRWVQENIAAFGGDSNSVTIFGQSAGGASVHHHIVSPLSRGLFHRAISQSGTVRTPWALTRPKLAKKHAQRLAKHFGCPTESSIELVDCLLTKEAADIIEAEKIFHVYHYDPAIPFRVVIEPDHEGAFMIDEPTKLLLTGNVADVPWMTGITSHEGGLKAAPLYGLKDKNYVKTLNEKWSKLALTSLLIDDLCPKKFHAEVSKKIREFYFGDEAIDDSAKWNLIDMYSDAWFNIGTDLSIRAHLETLSSPVYYYVFTYQGEFSLSVVFGNSTDDFGVCHSDELQYLYPIGREPNAYSEEALKMVDILTSLWYNFAKTGNPTPDITSIVPIKWKPVRTNALEYLHIENPRSLKMSMNLNPERTQFWRTIPHQGELDSLTLKYSAKDEL